MYTHTQTQANMYIYTHSSKVLMLGSKCNIMCVNAYNCIYMYIYVYTCIIYIYMYIYICIHIYIYIYVYIYIHIYAYMHECKYTYMRICIYTHTHLQSTDVFSPRAISFSYSIYTSVYTSYTMGWLRLVGSLKSYVSFAEYRLFDRALLQKRPIILRSLLIVATPYYTLHPYSNHIYSHTWRKTDVFSHIQFRLYIPTNWFYTSYTILYYTSTFNVQIHSIHHILSYTNWFYTSYTILYKFILYIIYYPILHIHIPCTHTHTPAKYQCVFPHSMSLPYSASTPSARHMLHVKRNTYLWKACQAKYIPMKNMSSKTHTYEKSPM